VAMSKKLLLLVKILTEIHYNYTHMLMQAQWISAVSAFRQKPDLVPTKRWKTSSNYKCF
jgi:hypothetical protein